MSSPYIAKGRRFEHARFIQGSPKAGTARPDVCTITGIRQGWVYYRTETGMLWCRSMEEFGSIVKRWGDLDV